MNKRMTPQGQRDDVFLYRARKPSLRKEIADDSSVLMLTVPIALLIAWSGSTRRVCA